MADEQPPRISRRGVSSRKGVCAVQIMGCDALCNFTLGGWIKCSINR
jgi:hypothetical protein